MSDEEWSVHVGDALIQDGVFGDGLGKLARHEATLMNAFTKTLQMLLLLQGNRGNTRGDGVVIEEEVDAYGLTVPPYYDSGGRLGGASIMVWGSEEQKQAFLPPIFRGEVRTWQLLTEPEAGSDLANAKTSAERDGDDYIIKGQKIYVGSSVGCDYM